MLLLQAPKNLLSTSVCRYTISKRPLFYWLTYIFNRVDRERIKEVGPDRACAEWLLRNGAFVRWKNNDEYLKDYNVLIAEQEQQFIEAVDATDSAISYIGFPHFQNCKYIQEVKLINCLYIEDSAMKLLSILKESLTDLEVSKCDSVTEEGLKYLENQI
ncbi:ATP synthase subunit s, mitochondrial isoform X2 [Prorops nasuta]|uniref:ATP synthase subunit s, mitochondrial isoform X2 n=1 Tax=Prorops nasuta TaxID=863751 RepID=UPI0034CE32A7